MPDARCTRGLVRNGEWMRARAYRLSGGTRHPLRDGFTAYAALSLVTGLGCHHRLAHICAKLERQRRGVRTTRFCRTLKRRSSCARPIMRFTPTAFARRRSRVHHIPPRVRDDARPPLLPEQDIRS